MRSGRAKPEKSGIDQRSGDLAHPIGAEIAHQHAITVVHSLISADQSRPYKLVGLAASVSRRNRIGRIRGAVAFAPHNDLIRLLDPVPTVVPIHRIIAAADRRKPQPSEPNDIAFEFLYV